jgi:hypothetical protein
MPHDEDESGREIDCRTKKRPDEAGNEIVEHGMLERLNRA